MEHPFFVFGQGWASCNPDKTQQCYGLKVHRLQVGDILISLTPREHLSSTLPSSRGSTATIMTTATSTAMTVRPLPVDSTSTLQHDQSSNCQVQPMNLHSPCHPHHTVSPSESFSIRKRSALDQICDDDERHLMRRHRTE